MKYLRFLFAKWPMYITLLQLDRSGQNNLDNGALDIAADWKPIVPVRWREHRYNLRWYLGYCKTEKGADDRYSTENLHKIL